MNIARTTSRQLALAFLSALASCASPQPGASHPAPRAATPTAPPATLHLDPFYRKHVDANGIPIVSSGKTSDEALFAAADIVQNMLFKRSDLSAALAEGHVHIAVIAATEQVTDIPEHSHLTPKDWWDQRARGLGGTPYIPTTSCGEENLLGLPDDRYRGESILIHEFAHAVHEVGMLALDKNFDARLQALYASAMSKGLWKDTYATTNHKEYWAEGVQDYFDCNLHYDRPNGVHNHIYTRKQLQEYDPELAALIDDVFAGNPWRWTPPTLRRPAPH